MKTYPITVAELRERICRNRECQKVFCPINDKALYCSLTCKNRESHLCRNDNYGELYKWFKMLIHNCKVLEYLCNNKQFLVTDETLNSMKFNFHVGPFLELIKAKGIVVPYGDYVLCFKDELSYEIRKIVRNGKSSI
jgi:hypothetical protein